MKGNVMSLVSFEEAVKDMNAQLVNEPMNGVTAAEEEFLIKMAIDVFKTRCGDVPSFYIETLPHGLVEVVLGVQCL